MDFRSTMISPLHFPDPLTFLPERWLVDANKPDKYLMPFSRGTRGCLGQKYVFPSPPPLLPCSPHSSVSLSTPCSSLIVPPPSLHHTTSHTHTNHPPTHTPTHNLPPPRSLALAEITLTIALLFRRFDFALYDTDARAVNVTRDRFAAGLDKGSKGTRVRVLREFVE